jgi:fatty-acyl-CoA synthase
MPAVAATVRSDVTSLRTIFPLTAWITAATMRAQTHELPIVAPDDVAQIEYTSGTTGFPKGALLIHRGLTNNARFYALSIGARDTDTWINPMPLFHTAGCGLATLGALQTRGSQVLLFSFDTHQMLSVIQSERGSIVLCVPTLSHCLKIRLLCNMTFRRCGLSHTRWCTCS